MDAKEFAKLLNGRTYRSEIELHEAKMAYDEDLVVVFGAYDDLMEFRGSLDDEIGLYDGGTAFVGRDDVIGISHNCDCEHCEFKEKLKKDYIAIEAVWGDKDVGASWSYKTSIPHETFNIYDEGELYCVGIVFSFDDLP
jgi:hypothetical protein